LISKPWTKIADIGFGLLLAKIYLQIREYREIKTADEKK